MGVLSYTMNQECIAFNDIEENASIVCNGDWREHITSYDMSNPKGNITQKIISHLKSGQYLMSIFN